MAEIILSADIGTSSLKAAFIDLNGRLRAFSRVPYTQNTVENSAGMANVKGVYSMGVHAQDWELAFQEALKQLHEQAADCRVDGICISGNGPTLVPFTKDGQVLRPIYWHDGKIIPSQKVPSLFLPYVAWLKENNPEVYEKTSLFISSHEWLAHWLGAEAFTVLPQKSYEPYYWDEQQCDLFGIDKNKFPPFVIMGSTMGCLSEKAAAALRPFSGDCLKSGVPIIAGGPDFITGLIGTGTLAPFDACDRAGSSEGINICVNEADLSGDNGSKVRNCLTEKGLRLLPHAAEGYLNIGAVIPSSGRQFEKYRAETNQQNRSYEEHLAELIPSDASLDFFKGGIFHRSSVMENFSDRISYGRAILCRMGFSVRAGIENLAIAGFPVKEMRVSGGQGKNIRWNQLKADITGVTLLIPEISDGELAGNAVLAVSALNESSAASGFTAGKNAAGLKAAADKMIRIRDVYMPKNSSFWEEHYKS